MARFTDPQRKGATRQLRDRRRIEADTRNALTPPHRRASWGRGDGKKASDR